MGKSDRRTWLWWRRAGRIDEFDSSIGWSRWKWVLYHSSFPITIRSCLSSKFLYNFPDRDC